MYPTFTRVANEDAISEAVAILDRNNPSFVHLCYIGASPPAEGFARAKNGLRSFLRTPRGRMLETEIDAL